MVWYAYGRCIWYQTYRSIAIQTLLLVLPITFQPNPIQKRTTSFPALSNIPRFQETSIYTTCPHNVLIIPPLWLIHSGAIVTPPKISSRFSSAPPSPAPCFCFRKALSPVSSVSRPKHLILSVTVGSPLMARYTSYHI